MPFPPRAATGEDDGSDEVSPAELHGVSFTPSFAYCNQESEQGQRQRRAPHSADAVRRGGVLVGQRGSARPRWGVVLKSSHLY